MILVHFRILMDVSDMPSNNYTLYLKQSKLNYLKKIIKIIHLSVAALC